MLGTLLTFLPTLAVNYFISSSAINNASEVIQLNAEKKLTVVRETTTEHIEDYFNFINDQINSYQQHYKTAIISRTNAMVIANAMKAAEENKKIYFVGGIKNYNFGKILEVEALYNSQKHLIKDFSIKKYKNFNELEKVAKFEENNELLFLCNVVKKYSSKLRASINKVNSLIVNDINQADITLTTAHKSKGLEFEQVILSNDFNKFFDKNDKIKQNIKNEEINILYVALTRAIYSLITNKELDKIIGKYHDHE